MINKRMINTKIVTDLLYGYNGFSIYNFRGAFDVARNAWSTCNGVVRIPVNESLVSLFHDIRSCISERRNDD